jgi:acyl-[acyl-carrier-protein] desaturase
MPAIDMPGVKMPHFRDLADVVRRVGIYGPRDYLEIVKEQLSWWRIDTLEGLNAMGRAAQEKLMEIPERLERVADAIEARSKAKTFSFDLTFAREFALE